jgi:beta-galactosidase GanA
LPGFIRLAQQEDLFVIVRLGPYIGADWEFGGLPSWLLSATLMAGRLEIRQNNVYFLLTVMYYFQRLIPILSELQFTNGGPIIMFQVEHELAYSPYPYEKYLQTLYHFMQTYGIVELSSSCDSASSGQNGTLPGLLFQTIEFGSDIAGNFGKLEEMQPNKPIMAMEFYSGWADHWTEQHRTRDLTDFRDNYEQVLAWPGSVNLYMFHGGTNWGFMNGANNGVGDNSNFQPITTSYDFDAPLTEAGDYTPKYDAIRELMKKYNTIETYTPDPPEVKNRRVYSSLDVNGQLRFENILRQAPDYIVNCFQSMENLPINAESGQSYGYIVYHLDGLNITANTVLAIIGHVRDSVMVLVNGVLISKPLTSSDRLDTFGYWRIENGTMQLTTQDLNNATLDLIFENWGRVGFGNFYNQFKGLTDSNRLFFNYKELGCEMWTIYPLEFKRSWNQNLSDWEPVDGSVTGPALYKATLTLYDDDITDTYIDMREWVKGFVIVNGIVLGRYATALGPQQALYLPGPWLHKGDNEIIVFEHSPWPPSQIKFTKDQIYNNP